MSEATGLGAGGAPLLAVESATNIGLVHHTNEDSHAVFDSPTGMVLAVCDGMGGMGRGDEASQIAVRVLRDQLQTGAGFPPSRMSAAIRAADVEIRKKLAVPGNTPGATAVVVNVENGMAHVAWAGDSRAYLLRAGAVVERTRDHKLVNELVDAGELTEAEARQSTLAHVVTKALGGRGPNEPPIQPDVIPHPWKLRSGDLILLCSDGLCDLVEDQELGGFIAGSALADDVGRLVQAALDRGGHDNITVILARWDGPDFDEEAHQTPLLSAGRVHEPLGADPALYGALDDDRRADETWDEHPVERARGPSSEQDQETIPPAPDRAGTPAPGAPRAHDLPPPRERAESERPQAWLAVLVALVAIGLIAIGLLLAQGVFTRNAGVTVDAPSPPGP